MTHRLARPDSTVFAAMLRGDVVDWPVTGMACSDDEFLAAAERHAVTPLIADVIGRSKNERWPSSLTAEIHRRAAESVARMALLEQELTRVLEELAAVGVPFLLIKGTGLAYTLYREPHLRSRFDTDLFVKLEDLPAASRVFEALGYRRSQQVDGDLLMQQVDYEKRDGRGIWHVYDLHWKIANPQAFVHLPTFGDLSTEAVHIGALGPHAWRPSDVHSLLIACVHQIAHHARDPKLIWMFDIHLLAERLDGAALRRFAQLAKATGVSGVCAGALNNTQLFFRTSLPEGLIEELEAQSVSTDEPTRGFIGGRTQLGVFLSDIRLVTHWTDRMRLIRQHVFPRPAYMLQAYGVQSPALLPALYTHRVVAGVWKWIRQ
jgi:hypothetical protein